MPFFSATKTETNSFHLDPKSKISPVMQQWVYSKSQYKDCSLFFRMGDFYELFFEDAIKLAPILDLKLTTRGTDHNDKPIPLAGLPVRSLNEYLQKVIDKGIPVAVVEQEEKPIKVKGKEFFPRYVSRVVTPGTILDPDLISSRTNNYLMVINFKSGNNWGWSLCDVSTGEFNIADFLTFQEMVSECVKINPSELILNESIKENSEFTDYFKQTFPNLELNFIEKENFDFDKSLNVIFDHFKVNTLEGYGIDEIKYKLGIESAGVMLHLLQHRKIPLIANKLEIFSNVDYLLIDPIAWKNLEIEQNLRDSKTQGTLLSILDETSTPMGARMLRAWLRKPLVSKDLINDRLDVVDLFLTEYSVRIDLMDYFQKITDLERICTKIFYKGALTRDLKRLEDSLGILPKISDLLDQCSKLLTSKLMTKLKSNIFSLPDAVLLINSALRENPNNVQDGDFIKDNYSLELDKLRDLKRNSKKFIENFEQQEQKSINVIAKKNHLKEPKIKVAYTRGHGYYIEVKSNVEVPANYSIARTLKDRTRYTTPELLELANKLLTAEEDIKELEEKLYSELLQELTKFIPSIKQISKGIAELDVLLSFSHLSNANTYTRPEISIEIIHKIKNGRHPIVEHILPYGEFIPNDTLLNNKDHSLLIISGANMGGKSTYLRQVALITLLAQMGCFVPAEHALIGIVDRIFTRVGIVDDIWRGQSHFMIEMIETANILNNATEKSLVLLDEIGRGTSTNTGLAIAWAVSKYLHEYIKCRTLFATHYHQLNAMEKKFIGINNYHMSVHYNNEKNQLEFLRKIEKGGTDESYGLEVAELAGFPDSVLNDARTTRKLIDEEMFFTKMSSEDNTQISSLDSNESLGKFESQKSKQKTQSNKSLLSFFEPKLSKIEQEILNLNLEDLSPIEALNLLFELQKKIK